MRQFLLAKVVLASLAGILPAQNSYYSASLDGAQVVPPSATAGRGWAVVKLSPGPLVHIAVFVAPPLAATNVTLRSGTVGNNGPVQMTLIPLGPGAWETNLFVSAATGSAVAAGGTYVEVTTATQPNGALRGQVVPSRTTRFTAQLDGVQPVPSSGVPQLGEAVAFLHEPDNRLVHSVISMGGGFGGGVLTELRMGTVGTNGALVATLSGGGGFNQGVTDKLSAAAVQALHGGGLYLAIPTASFPNGELRGQLRTAPDVLAGLTGAQQVPPVTTAGFGQACATINPDGSVAYTVWVAGMAGTAAHFHRGAAGTNGPIVHPLTMLASILWQGVTPPLTAGELAELRSGLWYVNVHSASLPGGEIRGQVTVAELPATFGGGCPDHAGGLAEIGTDSAPCLGQGFRVTLDGSNQLGQLAILALGFNRISARSTPLPRPLVDFGLDAPGCYVLHDIAGTMINFIQGNGNTFLFINVPLAPHLRGLQLYGQWYVSDLIANPFGIITSNAIELILQ